MGFNKIGRKCFFTLRTGFCLGMGTKSACFHDNGRRPSQGEYFKMSDTGQAKMSECSFKNHPGMLSGLLALHGLNFDSFLRTNSTDPFRVFTESGARKSGVKQCIGDKKA